MKTEKTCATRPLSALSAKERPPWDKLADRSGAARRAEDSFAAQARGGGGRDGSCSRPWSPSGIADAAATGPGRCTTPQAAPPASAGCALLLRVPRFFLQSSMDFAVGAVFVSPLA